MKTKIHKNYLKKTIIKGEGERWRTEKEMETQWALFFRPGIQGQTYSGGQLPHVELRSLQCGTGFRVSATLERTHFSHTYTLPFTLTEICACFSFALTIDTRVVIGLNNLKESLRVSSLSYKFLTKIHN